MAGLQQSALVAFVCGLCSKLSSLRSDYCVRVVFSFQRFSKKIFIDVCLSAGVGQLENTQVQLPAHILGISSRLTLMLLPEILGCPCLSRAKQQKNTHIQPPA